MKIKGLLIGVFLFVSTVYAEQSMEALTSFNNYAYFSTGNISLDSITVYESAKGQNISRLNLHLKTCNIEARDTMPSNLGLRVLLHTPEHRFHLEQEYRACDLLSRQNYHS